MVRKTIRKESAVDRQPGRKKMRRTAKLARKPRAAAKATPADAISDLVDASARALRIAIDPAWRAGVIFNLGLILRLGVLVDEFPLPDEAEPGPVFHA